MKHGFTLLLLTTCLVASAQTSFRFADSTAQWNLLTNENPMWCQCVSYYTTAYTIQKDTVISGKDYQKVGDKYFVRQDTAQKVFCRKAEDTAEAVIYDFAKIKGDTFYVSNPLFTQPVFCSVDSVDTVVLGGISRKRLFVNYNNIVAPVDEWIYGIGSLHSHFLNPGVDRTIVDGEWYKLLCFSEKGSQVYQAPFYNSCNEDTLYFLGINDVTSAQNVSVFPNPATSGVLTVINENENLGVFFTIYDVTGRLIFQKELNERATSVEVNGITRGVYLYSVQTNGRAVKNGKLIIE